MSKLFVTYILGILSFVMAITGVFSLFLSVPGLVLGIMSLKDKEKKITAQPFMTTRYLSYIAVGLNVFSIVVSLFATAVIAALFTAGAR